MAESGAEPGHETGVGRTAATSQAGPPGGDASPSILRLLGRPGVTARLGPAAVTMSGVRLQFGGLCGSGRLKSNMAAQSTQVEQSQGVPVTRPAGSTSGSVRSEVGKAGAMSAGCETAEGVTGGSAVVVEPAAGRDRVLIDGACGMCSRFRRVVGFWDWPGNLQWLDGSDQRVLDQLGLGITVERAMEAMIVVRADGRLDVGFDAIRRICRRVPAFWLAWPIMSLPGIRNIGHRLYRKVAARRTRSCQLPR